VGDWGGGIGSGSGRDSAASSIDNLTIMKGNITAGARDGPGIGSGFCEFSGVTLAIMKGNITANGSSLGAGIGSGSALSSVSDSPVCDSAEDSVRDWDFRMPQSRFWG
jgi:hypothetical protein